LLVLVLWLQLQLQTQVLSFLQVIGHVDINGNVNAFAIKSDAKDGTAITGGMAQVEDAYGEGDEVSINTGLLPSWLGVTGTTRQNDLDVSFTISFQPGASTTTAITGGGGTENRQAFVTFGDKSWGTVKVGKDLGIFASNAILNDMTLLGVGSQGIVGTSGGTTTTLGGIGTGYVYADWKGQISYTTPNMNGFQATIGITNPNQGSFGDAVAVGDAALVGGVTTSTTELHQDRFGIEGQVQYEWTGDIAGKVWASGASYDVTSALSVTNGAGATTSANSDSYTASVYDIGAAVTSGNLGLVAYYYNGDGAGTTVMGGNGVAVVNDKFKKRDSDGGYLQANIRNPNRYKTWC
jgi:predicted porin